MSGERSNGGMKKGPWSAEEDVQLIDYVIRHGDGNWNAVQRETGLARGGKSCRLRWANHLRPDLKKGEFTPEEEAAVTWLHWKMGNKWSLIASKLPGRSDNEIKNYWNTRVKRRQRDGLPLYSPEIPLQCQQQPVAAHGQYTVTGNASAVPPTAVPPQTEVLPTYHVNAELPSGQMGNGYGIEATNGAGTSNAAGAADTDQSMEDDVQTLIDMLATPIPPTPITDWFSDDYGGTS